VPHVGKPWFRVLGPLLGSPNGVTIKHVKLTFSNLILRCSVGPNISVGIVTGTGWTVRQSNPGWEGGEIFLSNPQTVPVAHSASCTMGTV